MTFAERIQSAFEHHETDKVPVHHISVSSRVASYFLGREVCVGGGIQQWREAKARWEGEDAHAEFLEKSAQDATDVAEAFEMDIVRPFYWMESRKPAKKIDEYTFFYGDPEGEYEIKRLDPITELYYTVENKTLQKQVECLAVMAIYGL
ncbi:hypothetical protein AUJ66_03880 [Candidatus Desantisbacteria bacterium CG1_02_38_46]|uniref:Uncharacterized protein n=3 Tax=unclassified Candidatus Desantisiibacteriota TaxID=3106372 RepID=A0A2H9P9F5_9BACT|nr:MAG: hypothetical protein AUJ66_03880 [Candidatus Desantisbacteria bacterium CG1_02_38_46]PIU51924.1 MAG: hypothetical protein COS91_01895 [Candidatus Desantisbacteria bacterium CG07_land_8_20_14_0_80_39_15]PIZ14875.1 MAG: hypothetical protein COY51_07060 [Candidatus Desantisbacteria bacterium CG_4_10_14_0_8_um_filter_39_17]